MNRAHRRSRSHRRGHAGRAARRDRTRSLPPRAAFPVPAGAVS